MKYKEEAMIALLIPGMIIMFMNVGMWGAALEGQAPIWLAALITVVTLAASGLTGVAIEVLLE